MIHELKCWPRQFRATAAGEKMFEIRLEGDRHFEIGDEIILREFDPDTGHFFLGQYIHLKITWIERGPSWGLPKDMVVMGIKQIEGR